MNIKEALKNINKKLALDGQDRYSLVSELAPGSLDTKCYSTGSPYLDYKIRNDNGGFPKGRMTLIVGNEGSGKSSLICCAAAKMQKEDGKVLVYFDSEGTLDSSHFDRFGVDMSLTVHRPTKNLEEALNVGEELSKCEDVGMIVYDSIIMFVSTTTEERTADENNMTIEARKFNSRMPIIYGNCNRRGISLVCVNFYREKPMAMGDPRYLSRGHWQEQMSSLTLDLTKKDLLLDNNKNVVGHELDVRIKKSKLGSADSKDAFRINLYHQYGFDEVDEVTSILIDNGVINKSGAWFSFIDESTGEEIKLQGKSSVVSYFKNNNNFFESIKNRLK